MVYKVLGAFIFVGAVFTTIMVSRYLTFDPDVYFPQQRETYITHSVGIFTHIIGGMIAMMIGPFQFIQRLRNKFRGLHRWMGRLYLAGCAAGGIGGLYMAFHAHGGFPAGMGFGLLGAAWLTTGAFALVSVLRRNFVAHREWMIRSYGLTLAALTLRVYLGVHGILHGTEVIALPFEQMYIAVAWLCWVPNLIAAECYINLSRASSRAATPMAAPGPEAVAK